MKNIKAYISNIIENGKSFDRDEFQDKISQDFMKSGIKFFINDSIAPFVFADERHSLSDVLERRCKEGLNGEVATNNYNYKKRYYSSNKENFKGLNYAYNFEGFEDVGYMVNTFSLFYDAIKGLNELNEDGSFNVSSVAKVKKTKQFQAHEFLIEENLSQFEEVCPAKNPNDKNAVCSIATIMLLRAIAQNGEEDEVDELAEQLVPFISFALKEPNRQFSDDQIYNCALALASERLERLNEGLDRDVYTAKLNSLKHDAKLFQEMRKSILDQNFSEYSINFSDNGENKKFSFVNKNGKLEECNAKGKKMEAYRYLDTKVLLADSVCDTDEEVVSIMFGNLLMLAYTKDEGTIENNKLAMAFALPLIQAVNKLGNEKANKIIKETVGRFNSSLKDEFRKKNIVKEILKPLVIDENIFDQIKKSSDFDFKKAKENNDVIVEDENVAEDFDEIATKVPHTEKTSKISFIKVRKEAIKDFNMAINNIVKLKSYTIDDNGKKAKVKLTPAKCEVLRNVVGFLQDKNLKLGQKLSDIKTVTQFSQDALKITNIFAGDYLIKRVEKLEDISGNEDNEWTNEQKKALIKIAKLSKNDIKSFAKDSVARIK